MDKQARTPGEHFEIRLVQTKYDGLRWAVCTKGSWKPLTTLRDLGAARAK